MPNRNLKTEDICEIFDVDSRTVTRWVAAGCPHDGTGRGKPRLFDEAEVAAWMQTRNLTGERGKPREPDGDELRAAKLRKELALAEKYETETLRVKGLLIDRAEAEASNVKKFATIRSKLLGVSVSLAPTLVGLGAPDIERAIEARIREALSELSAL